MQRSGCPISLPTKQLPLHSFILWGGEVSSSRFLCQTASSRQVQMLLFPGPTVGSLPYYLPPFLPYFQGWAYRNSWPAAHTPKFWGLKIMGPPIVKTTNIYVRADRPENY